MTREMGHDDAREMLALEAMDALEPAEHAALEAHLARCRDCRHELAELRATSGALAAAVPERAMEPAREARVRARLLARAVANGAGAGAAGGEVVPPTRESAILPLPSREGTRYRAPSRARMLAAAAIIIVGATLAYDAVAERQRAARLEAQLSSERQQLAALEDSVRRTATLVSSVLGPGVQVIEAIAAQPQQPYARMYWDQPTNRWTFVAYNLPKPATGRTLQLWLITKAGQKVSAGTFSPTPGGDALVQATYPLARDSLAAVAVTNEPAGGSPQPTQTPFLVGAATGR